MRNLAALFLCIACCHTINLSAQEFFIKAGAGYATSAMGAKMDGAENRLNGTVSGSNTSVITMGNNATTVTTESFHLKNASYSAGVQAIIGAGVMFSGNIGAELGASMTVLPHKFTFDQSIQQASPATGYEGYTDVRQSKGLLLLTPSLVLQTNNSKWNVYTRLGVALPFNTDSKLKETITSPTLNDMTTSSIKNYFSVGAIAALGVKLRVSNHLGVWAEVSMLYLNLLIKEQDVTSEQVNGVIYNSANYDHIPFSKTGPVSYNSTSANTQLTYAQPYSNLGGNVGLTYSFGNNAKRSGVGRSASK